VLQGIDTSDGMSSDEGVVVASLPLPLEAALPSDGPRFGHWGTRRDKNTSVIRATHDLRTLDP